jgi:flagellar biosynthesis/type III secretory pathway chaperone
MDEGTQRAPVAELLEVERDCCARLTAIVAAERSAIVKRDLPALLAALKEREVLQAQWQRASATRRAQLGSETSLAERVGDDPELRALLDEVRAAADALERAQRINVAIVRSALTQVGDLLDTVRRAHPGSSYDGRASLTAPRDAAGWSA